jgi:hypothetical protein
MIFRTPHSASKLAREMRLPSSRFGRCNPMQRQADLVLENKVVMQSCLIIRGQSHNQRALGAQLDVYAGRPLEFRRERRPTSLALAAERNESFLPRLGFRARGEHSGRGMRCARAGCAAIKDLDRNATSRQPPSNTKPDDAGANNDNLRLAEVPETIVQPVAPFAGMTQTGCMESSKYKGLHCQTDL